MVALTAAVRFHARQTPQRDALVYGGERVTYGALWERSTRLAGMLAARGTVKGDVVAVLMKNSAAFIEIALAASHAGAVLLPINFRLAAEEVEYILGHAGAKLLFVDEELVSSAGGFEPRVVVDARAQKGMLAQGSAPLERAAALASTDLFRLMYTSGTTDRPKGVIHTYNNYYWKCLDHVAALQLTAGDRLLVVGPLYHVGAFDLPGLAVLIAGGMLCVLREFDPEAALETIARERLTGSWMAPVMLNRLLAHAGRERFDLSSLRWLIGGGERTPEQRIREFTGLFRHGRYIDAYGLTESCAGDTLMEAGMEIAKIGSVGRAVPHVEIEIRDDAGRALPAGEPGEICLRGPKISPGYWREPAKTAASFFGDWFRTGDIGVLDGEEFLTLTDRKKDMIISGGENIASSEVERVLYGLAQVSEAAVIGLPDERWGERVVAVVVLRPGAQLSAENLAAHCRGHLAGFKVPKQLVVREALPRNPSGKVLKRTLRDELAGGGGA
ncbi:MAG: acyl-CoA synthetase [Betaproteobacteria bacterium RIFCSPLOWO2_12_FULL_67_28]|nr:MAG: acyl-CoA synthetase [Betaproteobacteria bacterium RIFCSPLOWO2_12_FULL_67_28]